MNLKFQRPGTGLHETEYSSRPPHAGQMPALMKAEAEHPALREAPPASPGIIFTPDFTTCADEILFV